MFVKSLTLKGFKSFASATNLVLEPGITCIVGPNGSGKSNVVDALAWVMGEGSARSLRGGKMDDVIFAGTPGRPALGRAEVTMTIDNTDGALPIDYTEVTISRTMFRGGGSEYAINRTPCRLLDIQELLSDSGIGREMHVIVGQGQLDAVLRATPEERRGFIEEAAGVLKHRRRKEKAIRKLDAMEGNLTRVADLTAEVRRQLGPLGRQAETARRAQTIQADVRDARLRLLADDLVAQRTRLAGELADEEARTARRAELEASVREAQGEVERLERQAADRAPVLERLNAQWYDLSALAERLDATARLAAERARLLATSDEEEQTTGRDPEALRRQAERVRGEEVELQDEAEKAQQAVDAAVARRESAEAAHQAEQQRLVRLARAAADRREGLAKLRGQVEARRSRTEAGQAEVGRLVDSLAGSAERLEAARAEISGLEETLVALEAREAPLNEAADAATARLNELKDRQQQWRDRRNEATQRHASAVATAEALEMTLGSVAVAADVLDPEADGLRGELVGHLRVHDGREAQVSVALGWAAESLVVESHAAAAALLTRLRQEEAGRVSLVVAESPGQETDPRQWPELPEGSVWVRDVVEAPEWLDGPIRELTDRLALVPDAATAQLVVEGGGTAVTEDGDVFAPTHVRGGGAPGRSALEIRAARDEAVARRDTAARDVAAADEVLTSVVEPLREAELAWNTAAEELHDNDADLISTMEQLSRHHQTIAAAGHERDRIQNSIQQAEVALEANRAEWEELELRLEQAQEEPTETEPDTAERDRLAAEAAAARTAETEHRLTLRTRQERVRALAGRAESLEAAARSELAARERAAAKKVRRRAAAEVAQAAVRGAERGRDAVQTALRRLVVLREEEQAEKSERDRAVGESRRRAGELQEALREITDSAHRDEVARAEQRLRIEALETRAADELGIDPDALVEEFGPHQPVPVLDAQPDEPQTVPFERAVQEKRLRKAERALTQLGKVNPLALEEFAALEERHAFLSEQLEDLRSSKRDLLSLVQEVDQRVEEVFTEAYRDVAAEFEGVFSRLFPGGEGRLVLTDPENMLTTGLDVEARPPGKKIKRLSLLSGGERSLVAVALLVSIFKARPSPFYIMDEVEAALDDANLGRLITLFEELRDSSQLIVITHQKRTMEVADALYGVTMRGDGITTVVSQRLGDVAPTG